MQAHEHIAGNAPGQWRPLAQALAEMRRNAPVYILIGALLLVSLVRAQASGEDFVPVLVAYVARAFQSFTLAGCAVIFVAALDSVRRDPRNPLQELRRRLLSRSVVERVPAYLAGGILLAVMMAAFLLNKMLIPVYAPFSWDATFARWDAALFGGIHPWQLLQPFLGYPAVTEFLDFVYALWVPFVFVFWIGALTRPVPQQLRSQYWLATVASWIVIGILLATAFSSAGPCYFDELLPGVRSPYDGLESYLASVDRSSGLMANEMKAYLWAGHIGLHHGPGGISAMPSMHNAQAVLFALAAYRLDRRFGHLMAAFAALIFIGSIHLGWHYAIDGIAGAAAAAAIWWAVGIYLRTTPRPAAVTV
jgi:hypothetical protein